MAGGVALAGPEAGGSWRLPEGWCWTTLGALGTWTGGGTPSKANSAFWTDGTVPWVSPKDMKVAVIGETEDRITEAAVEGSSTKYVPERSVLMVMRSGILKHSFPVAVTDRTVTLNQDLRALTPRSGISADYVARYLNLAATRVLHDCSKDGTTVDSIDASALERFKIPIAPFAEQRRIVARIDALFAEIDEGETALAAARDGLDTFRRALLKAAVTGELTKDWRTQNPTVGTKQESGHDLLARIKMKRSIASTGKRRGKRNDASAIVLDITTLPQLPEGWAWGTIDDIAIDTLIGLDRGAASQRPEPVGCPYIKMQNISVEGKVDLSNLVYVDADAEETSKYAIMDGDVLFNTRNSKELVGKTGIVNHPAPGTIFNNNLMRIRSIDRSTNQWLAVALVSPPFLERLEMIKKATTSVAAIYASDLFTLPIPIPPPAETDEILRRISKALSASADTLSVLDAEAADAARLKQSILKAAFEGRLVPQDPADEPASALLARLSAPAPEARRGRGARTRAK